MTAKKTHLTKHRLRLESLERRELLAAEIGAQTLDFSSDGLWAATGELQTVQQDSAEVAVDQNADQNADQPAESDQHLFLMDPSRFYRALSQVDADGSNSQVVNLPTPDGGFDAFSITSKDVVSEVYLGRGVNDDTLQVQLQMSGAHFRAQVISPDAQYGIDRLYSDDLLLYSSYSATESSELPQFVDHPAVPYSALLDPGNAGFANIDPNTLQESALMLAPGMPVMGDALSAFHEADSETENGNQFAEFTFNDNSRWSFTATDGGGLTQGDATTLTWSIVPDGTSIPGRGGAAAENSSLVDFLGDIYGVVTDDTDYTDETWFPLFEDYLNRWGELTGITYVYEPADDGDNFQSVPGQLGVRGDIRISGRSVDGDGAGTLAYNFFPNNGDMVIDTDNVTFYGNTANNSLSLRNVLSHENGHGIGIGHVCPVIGGIDGRLMEPFINTNFDGPQFDDVLAGQRGYGDTLEKNGGNDSTAMATDLGLIADGTTVSVGADVGLGPSANRVAAIESDFVSIDDDSDIDVYAFSLMEYQELTVTLTPVGPSYLSGPQNPDGSCSAGTDFEASLQNDLDLEIINGDGVTVRNVSATPGLGLSETIFTDDMDAGDYFVRVTGGDNAAQMYQLDLQSELRIGELIYTPSENPVVSENGLQDSYSVSLDRPAGGNVLIEVTAGPDLEISLVNGVFGTTQGISLDGTDSVEILVRAIDDTIAEGIHFDTISHEIIVTDNPVVYPVGLPINPVTAQIYDNEAASLQRVDPLGGLVSRSTGNIAFIPDAAVGQPIAPIDYEVFIQAGQSLSAISMPESGAQVTLTVSNETGTVLATAASQTSGDTASVDQIQIDSDGVYTISVVTDQPGLLDTEWYLNAALEAHYDDSGISSPVTIDGTAIDHAGLASTTNRFAAIGALGTADDPAPGADPFEFKRSNDPAAFIDISGTGNALNLADDGEVIINTSVGNIAIPAGDVTISNNGVLAAGNETVDRINQTIPTNQLGTALLPFWDDLSNGAGDVYWQEMTIDGIDALVVQWNGRPHFDVGGTDTVTFQVQLFDSGPVLARYAYQDVFAGSTAVDAGRSATIGYQRSNTAATSISFNSASVANGDVIDLEFTGGSNVDVYQVDMAAGAARTSDIVLTAIDGSSLAGATLELVGVDGTTVLATGNATGAGSNFDIAIQDFELPDDGAYTVRVSSNSPVKYSLVVNEGSMIDTEPNAVGQALRSVDGDVQLIGYIESVSDNSDAVAAQLQIGQTVELSVTTLFPQSQPLVNDLVPGLFVVRPNGQVDSVVSGTTYTAVEDGVHQILVNAITGEGEYLLDLGLETLPPLTLTVDDLQINENGGVTNATISRAGDLSAPLTVTLNNSDTTEADAPTVIVIPAGQATSAPFQINGVDDLIPDGVQFVTFRAEAAGYRHSSETIAVLDDEPAVLTVTIDVSGMSENGGVAIGTVSRAVFPAGNVVVFLNSDDLTEATVPNAVLIPAGEFSATFEITAVDDLISDGTQTVTISATNIEFVGDAATIDVLDDEGLISGRKFSDDNGNGFLDPGESPLAGWTIFLDLNNDGDIDTGGAAEPDDQLPSPISDPDPVINNAYADVTLSAIGINSGSGDVLSTALSPADLSSRVFGHDGGTDWNDLEVRLRAEFDTPKDFFSIDYISSGGVARVQVFDVDGVVVDELRTGNVPAGTVETISLQRAENDIGAIIVGGFGADTGKFDNLQFGIDEPFTVTDAQGRYSFDDLLTGRSYIVREVQQDGWVQTSPSANSARPAPPQPVSSDTGSPGDFSPDLDHPYTNTEVLASILLPTGQTVEQYLLNATSKIDTELASIIAVDQSYELFNTGEESVVFVALQSEADPLIAIEKLTSIESVQWVTPNHIYDFDGFELTPDDPDFGVQYHHALMETEAAWDTTLGDPSIIIGITDNGVDLDHEDLVDNIWVNLGETANNGIDDDNNGFIDDVNGWDFVDQDNNPNPNGFDDHGTHVSGIAAARTNNDTGVAGVAGGSTILPIKIAGSENGNFLTADVFSLSYRYASDNGARILNTSFNVNAMANNPVYLMGLEYFYDNGGLHFNSAGNTATYNPIRQSMDHSFFVANTTSLDTLSPSSSYGHGIDIAAPGTGIYATVNDDAYGFKSGTSMAAPNAAGVAALIWSANPGWTRDQVAAQLIGMADNIDAENPGFEGLLGSGRVNANRAVNGFLPDPQLRRLVGLPQNFETTDDSLTGFAVDFLNVFDPASVDDENSWELREAGFDGQLDTSDDVFVLVRADTQYAVGTNRLSFTFDDGALAPGSYRFTAFAGGLEDPFGRPLDGDGNGVGGDDLVRFFDVAAASTNDAHVVDLSVGGQFSDLDFLNRPPNDFGDAPTARQLDAPSFVFDYPTRLEDDGARHLLAGPVLGTVRDGEPDGFPTVQADGDDLLGNNTDDDGIAFASSMIFSSLDSATQTALSVEISNASPGGNYLDGWIDFNRDGDWNDLGEKIISAYDLGTTNGLQAVDFTIPQDVGANVETGTTYARFRLSTDSSGLAPTGYTNAGEVEDYAIEVQNPPDLVFSEIMASPSSDSPDWQWVEVYNNSDFDLDLQGFVLDTDSGALLTDANLTTGVIPANSAAVLYNDVVSDEEFQAAWGGIVSLVPVSNWSPLSESSGTLGFWTRFNQYDDRSFENAVESVTYFDDANSWPDLTTGESIALVDIEADSDFGGNWTNSVAGISGAYANQAAGGNVGGEVGSPGIGVVTRLNPFERLKTLGSYIAISRNNAGTVFSDSDFQDFVVFLEAGETVTAEAQSTANASVNLQWLGSGQELSVSRPGETITTPMFIAQADGFHTIRVRADGFSNFRLDIAVNAVLESSVDDTRDDNELSLNETRHNIGTGSFYGAIGNANPVFGNEVVFNHENDPSQFIDISQTGTQAFLFNNSTRQIQTTVGNPLFPSGTVTISDDGTLGVGPGSPDGEDNEPLPAVPFATALFPFWDSLVGTRLQAPNVYYQEMVVDGVDTLIIQWNDAEHTSRVGDPADGLTFQVQVFDSNTTLAKFAYRDVKIGNPAVDNGASATIGFMQDSNTGVEFSRNEASVIAGDVITLAIESGPDVDEYEIDLSEFTGETVDFVLSSTANPGNVLTNGRFRRQSLELIDRDGVTVLASGTDLQTNADLAILGYVVPRGGTYTLRFTSAVSGEYTLSVAESLTIEIEDNGSAFNSNPRIISPTRLATGYIGNGNDDLDYFQFTLLAGQTIQVESETPHDSFLDNAPNTLDPIVELTRVNFPIDLLAGDHNSAADGRNALFNFTAPETGQYLIRVIPDSGEGEYLLHLRDVEVPSVDDIIINNGNEQRSILTELEVHFGSEVIAPASAFQLRNRDTGRIVNGIQVTNSLVDGQTISQITFTSGPFVESRADSFGASLADGNYELRIFGNQIRSASSGSNLPADVRFGDQEADQFFRLFGDSDGDRDVDGRDYGRFGLSLLTATGAPQLQEYFDHDGDGDVDGRDYGHFGMRFLGTMPF